MNDLRLVSYVGHQSNDADAIIARRVVLANDAENNQGGGEHRAEGGEFATFGFEEIEKIARFHG